MRFSPSACLPVLAACFLVAFRGPVLADTHAERSTPVAGATERAAGSRADETTPDGPLPAVVKRVIELTNRERLKAGLPALKPQRSLLASASWMARDMAEHGYFDHRDSTRRDMPARLTDFKYAGYHALGENIAMGQRTPEEAVETWMHSPGHRANILSARFSEIGVGYVPPSAHNAYGYWVQDFGSRFERTALVIDEGGEVTDTCRVRLSIHGDDWVEQMRLSNDGASWTEWEEFRTLRDWDLDSGDGKRTVYVEFRRPGRTDRVEAAVLVETLPRVEVLEAVLLTESLPPVEHIASNTR
jgi:uncharacterized protein YkwD